MGTFKFKFMLLSIVAMETRSPEKLVMEYSV